MVAIVEVKRWNSVGPVGPDWENVQSTIHPRQCILEPDVIPFLQARAKVHSESAIVAQTKVENLDLMRGGHIVRDSIIVMPYAAI